MLVTTGHALPQNTAPSAHQAATTKTPRERRGKSCRRPRNTERVSAPSARGIGPDTPERERRATGSMRSKKTDALSAGRLATAQSAYCRALKKCADREIRVKDWEGCIDVARRRLMARALGAETRTVFLGPLQDLPRRSRGVLVLAA